MHLHFPLAPLIISIMFWAWIFLLVLEIFEGGIVFLPLVMLHTCLGSPWRRFVIVLNSSFLWVADSRSLCSRKNLSVPNLQHRLDSDTQLQDPRPPITPGWNRGLLCATNFLWFSRRSCRSILLGSGYHGPERFRLLPCCEYSVHVTGAQWHCGPPLYKLFNTGVRGASCSTNWPWLLCWTSSEHQVRPRGCLIRKFPIAMHVTVTSDTLSNINTQQRRCNFLQVESHSWCCKTEPARHVPLRPDQCYQDLHIRELSADHLRRPTLCNQQRVALHPRYSSQACRILPNPRCLRGWLDSRLTDRQSARPCDCGARRRVQILHWDRFSERWVHDAVMAHGRLRLLDCCVSSLPVFFSAKVCITCLSKCLKKEEGDGLSGQCAHGCCICVVQDGDRRLERDHETDLQSWRRSFSHHHSGASSFIIETIRLLSILM